MRNDPDETFLDRRRALETGEEVRFSFDETQRLLADMRAGGMQIARTEAMELLGKGHDRGPRTILFRSPGSPPTQPPTVGTFLYQWRDCDAEKVASCFTSMLNSIDRPRSASLTYAVWAEPR